MTLRAAACAINDYWDKDLDKHVERCKSRPMASDQLGFYQALGFCVTNTAIGCSLLAYPNPYTLLIGLFNAPLVIAYPLVKRFSFYP